MATYDISGWSIYNGTSGTVSFAFNQSVSETVDDSEADNTFEFGDTAFSGNVSYQGQLDVPLVAGGTMSLAIFSNGPQVAFAVPAAMTFADFNFPPSFDMDTRNTADFPTCFAAGTMIETPTGPVRVEDLSAGDVILTADGTETAVLWLGRQTLHPAFVGAKSQPVCIKAGALGGGLPHSDLTVTADHGMVLDGYVVNASALVNGDTIDFVPMDALPQSFCVYHIETEAHDIILANGAASETFIDAAGRHAFDNYAEYLNLYGAERIIPEMQMPRITSARLLPDALAALHGVRQTDAFAKVG